jgi:hypothetical protein
VFLSFLFITCVFISCHESDRVVYEVTGNADQVDITISNDYGSYEEYKGLSLPWRVEYGQFKEEYVYLYAYNNGEDGDITVTIYVNDRVFKSATCSGPYENVVVTGEKDSF